MMHIWKRASIRKKIIVICLSLFAMFTLFFLLYFIPSFGNYIVENRHAHIRDMTGLAISTCETYFAEAETGRMSRDEAFSRALYHINKYRYGADSTDSFFIISSDGIALSFPYREDLVGKDLSNVTDSDGFKYYQKIKETAVSAGEGYITYKSQYKAEITKNVPFLVFYKYYKPFDIIIASGVYMDDIHREIFSTYIKIFVLFLIASVVAFIILYITSKTISSPLKQLIQGMAASDLNTKLSTDSLDEVGEMAAEFNRFVSRIREMVLAIKDLTHQLAASSEELSSISVSFAEKAIEQNGFASEINRFISTITADMDSVTKDIDKEFNKLNSLIVKMEALSEIILTMNSESQNALKQIESMRLIASEGERSLNQMIESVNRIANRSGELYGILDMINGISGQINLLSLNAAIEAARAGEYGRGFAVVSDEISKLADETSNSLKTIGTIIMDNDSELKNGVVHITNSVETIRTLIQGIDSIGSIIEDVASRSLEQIGTKEKVDAEIAEIKNMSEGIRMTTKVQILSVMEINSNVRKISESSSVITAASEELASSSEEVSGMAEHLNAVIQGFKV